MPPGAPRTSTTQSSAEEEAVAAEFIATEETIENVSGFLAALSKIGEIQNEQFRTFFADHRDTLKALPQVTIAVRSSRDSASSTGIGRATHIADGLTRTVGVISQESGHANTVDRRNVEAVHRTRARRLGATLTSDLPLASGPERRTHEPALDLAARQAR